MEGCFTFQWGEGCFSDGGITFKLGVLPMGRGIDFDGRVEKNLRMQERGGNLPPHPPHAPHYGKPCCTRIKWMNLNFHNQRQDAIYFDLYLHTKYILHFNFFLDILKGCYKFIWVLWAFLAMPTPQLLSGDISNILQTCYLGYSEHA